MHGRPLTEHHDMLANFAPKVCARTGPERQSFAFQSARASLKYAPTEQVKLIPEAHETAMANKRLFEDLGFGEDGAEVST